MTRWPRKQLHVLIYQGNQHKGGEIGATGTTDREVQLGRRWREVKRYISNKYAGVSLLV